LTEGGCFLHNEASMFARHHLVLGRTGPWSFFPAVTVSEHDRTGHMYLVGKTGKGKSKLLASLIFQDIAAGRGVAVIDPHSDLVHDVLALLHNAGILEREQNRIIYLNPAEHEYVIPFNVLATPGDPYEIAQSVIEAFRRTWPASLSTAPHFENIMLHALLVLIQAKLTLVDLPQFLTEFTFREDCLQQVNVPELTSYFHARFDAWSAKDPRLLESSLNKITALTLNPHLKLLLVQKENRLNFRTIMDAGKVLLCDFGSCGDESQRLVGNLVTTGIEQAVFTRHDTDKRRPFYLYIDEFQDFVADGADRGGVKTFSKILSGARKYGLSLCVANQNLSQLSERMKGAIMGNVWTKVIFGVSEPDAFEFARYIGLGSVDPNAIKEEAKTETQHPIFQPLPEQWNALAAALANQKPREAIVRTHEGMTKKMWAARVDTTAPAKALREAYFASLQRHGYRCEGFTSDLRRLSDHDIVSHVSAFYE